MRLNRRSRTVFALIRQYWHRTRNEMVLSHNLRNQLLTVSQPPDSNRGPADYIHRGSEFLDNLFELRDSVSPEAQVAAPTAERSQLRLDLDACCDRRGIFARGVGCHKRPYLLLQESPIR